MMSNFSFLTINTKGKTHASKKMPMDKSGKILIAEREMIVRRSLALAIRSKGHEVIAVEDGNKAWEIMSSGYHPNILFLDVLSDELHWIELCKLIKEHRQFRDVRIICLTDRWSQADMEKARSVGVDEYMTKPFSPSSLLARIQEIIEGNNVIDYRQFKKHNEPDPEPSHSS